MKPARFDYVKPESLEEAKHILSERADDAKILAGGQTLVPMMNFRLAAPGLIVDINGVPDLDEIEVDEDGTLKMGALVRWRAIETSPVIRTANPLLAEAISHVAHYQIRNRGTWAGSSAHADPASEFPAVAIICDAEFTLVSAREERTVVAEKFFQGALTTALEPDELLIRANFPAWPPGRKWAFEEFAFRSGDFAIVGIAVIIDEHPEGRDCRIVCFGVGDRQSRLREAEKIVNERGIDLTTFALAGEAAAGEVEAQDDTHSPADYRRALVSTLTYRTLCRATGLEGNE